jgi:hypothetical protein
MRGKQSDDRRVLAEIERFWREAGTTFISGWLHAYEREVIAARACQDGGGLIEITDFSARPDLLNHYPMIPKRGARTGFSVHLPAHAGSAVRLLIDTEDGTFSVVARPNGIEPGQELGATVSPAANNAFERFCAIVNQQELDVLEIGSRRVGMLSKPMRDHFPRARRYVGMDIHGGPDVDLVGDVHELSKILGCAQFDAVFSIAVMEHIAMPWIAAVEMNRVLKLGGLALHRAPQTWPVHAQPNDFWRFTDEGLKVLFGPLHGFEVIEGGMGFEMTIYPKAKTSSVFDLLPFDSGFGDAHVLSRKIAEIGRLEQTSLKALSDRYPAHPNPDSGTYPNGIGNTNGANRSINGSFAATADTPPTTAAGRSGVARHAKP